MEENMGNQTSNIGNEIQVPENEVYSTDACPHKDCSCRRGLKYTEEEVVALCVIATRFVLEKERLNFRKIGEEASQKIFGRSAVGLTSYLHTKLFPRAVQGLTPRGLNEVEKQAFIKIARTWNQLREAREFAFAYSNIVSNGDSNFDFQMADLNNEDNNLDDAENNQDEEIVNENLNIRPTLESDHNESNNSIRQVIVAPLNENLNNEEVDVPLENTHNQDENNLNEDNYNVASSSAGQESVAPVRENLNNEEDDVSFENSDSENINPNDVNENVSNNFAAQEIFAPVNENLNNEEVDVPLENLCVQNINPDKVNVANNNLDSQSIDNQDENLNEEFQDSEDVTSHNIDTPVDSNQVQIDSIDSNDKENAADKKSSKKVVKGLLKQEVQCLKVDGNDVSDKTLIKLQKSEEKKSLDDVLKVENLIKPENSELKVVKVEKFDDSGIEILDEKINFSGESSNVNDIEILYVGKEKKKRKVMVVTLSDNEDEFIEGRSSEDDVSVIEDSDNSKPPPSKRLRSGKICYVRKFIKEEKKVQKPFFNSPNSAFDRVLPRRKQVWRPFTDKQA